MLMNYYYDNQVFLQLYIYTLYNMYESKYIQCLIEIIFIIYHSIQYSQTCVREHTHTHTHTHTHAHTHARTHAHTPSSSPSSVAAVSVHAIPKLGTKLRGKLVLVLWTANVNTHTHTHTHMHTQVDIML